MIYRSPAGMKETVGEFLNFCTAGAGGQTYIAADELAMFCRDLLPLLKNILKWKKRQDLMRAFMCRRNLSLNFI